MEETMKSKESWNKLILKFVTHGIDSNVVKLYKLEMKPVGKSRIKYCVLNIHNLLLGKI